MDNQELTAKLLERMSQVKDPDYYEALIAAGMDETGNLEQAIALADELYTDEEPTADDVKD